MGAVMPSGRVLARTMAQYVDIDSDGPVVELGPGTGAITNALIEHGVDQKRLVLVEYNPGFCALLRDRYPQAKVVQGDAYTLRDSLLGCAERAGIRGGLRPAAGHQADADAPEADPRCLRGAGAGRAVRAVHLFGGAADSEIAAGRVHRSLRADLDEPSAGPCLGVSQGLIPAFPAPLSTRAPLHDGLVSERDLRIMSALKILVIPGSLRTGSLNARLAAAAAHEFAQAGAEVTRISLGDFPLPIYDGDLQTKSGVPKNAINLKRMIGAHHGVLIVTPEYNSSVPPLVKNTIDWVSRVQDAHETRGQVFRERAFAIAAASESRLGGTRALAALRLILSACHAMVIPNQLALSFADEAYDDMDRLKHPADIEALDALVRQLIDVSQRMM